MARIASTAPGVTILRNPRKPILIESPTTNEAGSPTKVSRPELFAKKTSRNSSGTKSVSKTSAILITTGASRITIMALGSTAAKGAITIRIRNSIRFPLPRDSWHTRRPIPSKIPVGAKARTNTIPPKNNAMVS
jgi:hypothetical protein